MMDEYISKPLAVGTLEMLRLHYQNIDGCSEETVRECRRKIEKLKTEDVAPVSHGKWVGKPIAGYCNIRCSECGEIYYNNGKWKYCPNCGARMDG